MTSRTPLTLSAMLSVLLLSAPTGVNANASTINYSMTIDGSAGRETLEQLAPGEHTLEIWGEVTDNVLEGSNNGGILQFSFNLDSNAPSAFTFEPNLSGFPKQDDGTWKSTFPSVFSTTFRGRRDTGGYLVGAQTGSIGAANFGDHPFTVGSNAPSLLTSGKFTWDGTPAILELIPGDLTGHLVFTDLGGGNFGAGNPDSAVGMSLCFCLLDVPDVPEPAAMSLDGLAIAGVLGFRRRR